MPLGQGAQPPNPENPKWFNVCFVLSAGHGCMLLYSLLHRDRYKEQSASKTSSIPAVGLQDAGPPGTSETPGVEVTTGPLGSSGIANAVAWRSPNHMAAKLNRPAVESGRPLHLLIHG